MPSDAPDGVRRAGHLTEVSAMSSQRQSFRGAAWRRLLVEQRGAVAAIMGLAIIPLFAVLGLAIDTGRGYMLKSKLSYAIDAAGLAGGRAFNTDQREDDIMMFFEANFPTHYMNSELLPDNPVITFDDAQNTVTIEASATIPTYFMNVVGVPEVTVSARTVIQRELRGMELVLVMDNTGSMRGNGGMDAMKPAATDLINILYGDRETVPQFWVGLVPYAASVNIGTQHEDWLTGYNAANFLPTTWKGCVEARAFPNDSNDATPDVQLFTPLRWATTFHQYQNPFWTATGYTAVVKNSSLSHTSPGNLIYLQGSPSPSKPSPTKVQYAATTPSTWGRWLNGDNEWDPSGPESALKLDNDLYQNQGTGPNLGCGPAITPLVSSKTTILNAIDDMAPWHRGGTMANQGLAWGWRVLSPNWRGRWDGDLPDELPLDYETPNMEKVIILLTDGNNEWYDYPGITFQWGGSGANHYTGIPGNNAYPTSPTNWRNQFQTTWPGADYTAYGRLSEGRLGTTNQAAANAVLDDRMLDMCQTMKAQGIIIYTMTFGPSPDADTRTLYETCATEPDMYFNAPSAVELQQAFVQIADELSALRIAE
jgi:Flp pilus assembly protein TadG